MTPTPNPGEARPEPTPLTDAVWKSVEHKSWQSSFEEMHDHAEKLERSLATAHAKLEAAEKELQAERNLHGQTRVVVEELNTICNDLRNAGQPQFVRSEAIRLLREDQATLRAQLAQVEAERDKLRVQLGQACGLDETWPPTSLFDTIRFQRLESQLRTQLARITQLESERDNWRVSSVNRELAKDRERLEYVRKNFANAIHYCCRNAGDEWNTKFYETLDKWMARDAARSAANGEGK